MTEHIAYLDDIEDVIIAKYLIEKKLIENNELEERAPLQDFLTKFINMNKTIAVYNINKIPEMVPFFIYENNDDLYIFFAEKNPLVQKTLDKLRKINYSIDGLKEYSGGDDMLRIDNSAYDF